MRQYQNQRNPVLPVDIHIPDGEPHVMPDGKLYIYGSFDDGEQEYCSSRYYVVSTPDLKNWTIHDCAFRGRDAAWVKDPEAPVYPGPDWAHPTPFMKKVIKDSMKGKSLKELMQLAAKQKEAQREKKDLKASEPIEPLLYAPDCLYKDGKYYLYFCLADGGEGVAVSDHPEGPFADARQLPCGGIDPAVFADEDGQVYYYWSQFFGKGVRLNEDLVSFAPENVVENLVTEQEHFFHEGSSMRKIGDTYYYIYADMERGKPTALGYSTSKNPLGPFIYRGIIIDNAECDPNSWNNHGSIECFDGQWYVCYHRSSRNSRRFRHMCMEKIEILPDGTIPEVKMTSQGTGEPFAPGEKIQGYQVCGLSGSSYIDADDERGEKVTRILPGDELIFRYIRETSAYTHVRLETRGTGVFTIMLDDCAVGRVEIFGKNTGDLQTVTAAVEMKGMTGERSGSGYEVKLKCEKAKTEDLELLSLTFLTGEQNVL